MKAMARDIQRFIDKISQCWHCTASTRNIFSFSLKNRQWFWHSHF